MRTISDERLGGLTLAIGGLLYLVSALLRPGSIIIEPLARLGSQVERVEVLANNAIFTHATSLLGVIAAFATLFGFVVLRRLLNDHSVAHALTFFGLIFLAFSTFFFAFGNGLNQMIAHTVNQGLEAGRSVQVVYTAAVNIQLVKGGLLILHGYGFFLSFAFISLGFGLHLSSRTIKIFAFVISGICWLAVAKVVIGDYIPDAASILFTSANFTVLAPYLFALVLGAAFYRGAVVLKQPEE